VAIATSHPTSAGVTVSADAVFPIRAKPE